MKKLLVAAAAMAISTGAIAGPSWTYVDLGAIIADGSNSEDTTGLGLRGSFGFGDLWHIQAEVASFELNGGKGKCDLEEQECGDVTTYVLRGGIHPAVTDDAQFVLDIGYQGGEVKTRDEDTSGKIKPSTYDIRGGYRQNIGALELRGFISYARTDDDAGNKEWNIIPALGLQYNFSDAWSVGIDTEIEDDNQSDLYVRWSF